ncbi:hypothetical protein PAPYR_12846 [Paratrimastix pyriformis]|uniref:Uncharacterized protein n=1 Tax=Paratrimastix pyriformis TaxID=342808 RepID=A0ABQ8U182_9EUKA|nr:hypothetical protein PAPYR_12846 [Paratrimastix pyriformis]
MWCTCSSAGHSVCKECLPTCPTCGMHFDGSITATATGGAPDEALTRAQAEAAQAREELAHTRQTLDQTRQELAQARQELAQANQKIGDMTARFEAAAEARKVEEAEHDPKVAELLEKIRRCTGDTIRICGKELNDRCAIGLAAWLATNDTVTEYCYEGTDNQIMNPPGCARRDVDRQNPGEVVRCDAPCTAHPKSFRWPPFPTPSHITFHLPTRVTMTIDRPPPR